MGNVVRVLTTAAATMTVLAGTDTAAQAANPPKHCQAPPGQIHVACQLLIPSFPGGTMSIDVDANGSGTGHWILFKHGSLRACETDYDLRAPAQSWICRGLGADHYVLYNVGNKFFNWRIPRGARVCGELWHHKPGGGYASLGLPCWTRP